MQQDQVREGLTESMVRAIVRDEYQVLEAQRLMQKRKEALPSGWQKSREAAAALGVRPWVLNNARNTSLLRLNRDYRQINRNPNASTAGIRFEYHVENCRKLIGRG